jgi:CspA family cold shock protein
MNYRDKMLACEQCGSQFVFTVTEQRKMTERGAELLEPKFCPRCRVAEVVEVVEVVEEPGARLIGQVKWFDAIKGCGFITKANGEDIFVHNSGIKGHGTLQDGQDVEFQIEQTAKGASAVEVIPLPMDE